MSGRSCGVVLSHTGLRFVENAFVEGNEDMDMSTSCYSMRFAQVNVSTPLSTIIAIPRGLSCCSNFEGVFQIAHYLRRLLDVKGGDR